MRSRSAADGYEWLKPIAELAPAVPAPNALAPSRAMDRTLTKAARRVLGVISVPPRRGERDHETRPPAVCVRIAEPMLTDTGYAEYRDERTASVKTRSAAPAGHFAVTVTPGSRCGRGLGHGREVMPGERTATNRKPPTRQEEMSAESQRRLRAAAVRLFAERGYRGASLQDIGEAAGISRGSITWHFKSKAGLLEAIVADIIERTLEALGPRFPTTTRPPSTRGWSSIATSSRRTRKARIFPMLLLEAIGPDSELRPSYRAVPLGRPRADPQAPRDRGGPWRPRSRPRRAAALAATIWAALVGADLQWRLDEDFDIAAVTTTLAALVPLRPRPPSPPS